MLSARRLRRLGIAGCSLAGSALLAACGSAASASGSPSPGAVTHVSLWESHSGGPVAATVSKMVSQFNATHHSVQVSVNVTKASTKALAALAAGSPPLLAEISHYDGKFLQAHALVNLNHLIYGPGGLSASQRKAFFPAIWHNGEVGGKHYRLQVDAKVSEYFYNKALFARAGISSPPATWAQMTTDLTKLSRLGVVPLGVKDASAHIEPMFVSNGGHLTKPASHMTATQFDSAAGRQSFSYIRSLFSQHLATFGHGSTLRADLASGKMAIIDGTSAGYEKVLQSVNGHFGVGAFGIPSGSSGHSANMVQGLGFVIMKGHPPAQEQAAWSFVKWYLAPRQQAYWAMHSGFAPETRTALRYIPSSWLATHPGMAVSIAALESPYTFPRVNSQNYSEVESALDAAWFKAATTGVPLQPLLSSLDAKSHQYLTDKTAL